MGLVLGGLRSIGVVATFILVMAACGGETGVAPETPTADEADTTGAETQIEFESIEDTVPVGYEEPDPGEFRLAYLNPLGANEFLSMLGQAMRAETERLGGSYVELDAQLDVDTQVSQFEQLVAQEVDGIFAFPLDPGAVQPVLERAKAMGIAVITIDFNFESTEDIGDFDSQIWQRRDEAAYLAAREMFRNVGAGAQVATIDFVIQVPSIVYSVDQITFWAEEFGLEVAGNASNPTDDIAGGEIAMTELLGNFPDLSGVIGYNDPSAIGAAAAARAQGQRDLVFGGQNGGSDGLEAIRAGRITYTVQYKPPSMGKFAAWGLYNILQGRDVPTTVKADAPEVVTQDNIESIKSWDEVLEEEYGAGG